MDLLDDENIAGTVTDPLPRAINGDGVIVGEVLVNGELRAFVWFPRANMYGTSHAAGMHDLDALFGTPQRSRAWDVNDEGVIVGERGLNTAAPPTDGIAYSRLSQNLSGSMIE